MKFWEITKHLPKIKIKIWEDEIKLIAQQENLAYEKYFQKIT
jgi:hypothetical protein